MDKHPKIRTFDQPLQILEGEKVTFFKRIYEVYNRKGSFRYQFMNHKGVRCSRVMLCDNDGELVWLAGQVKKGSVAIISPVQQ